MELWLAFCLLEMILCLTPGPAVLSVISAAVRGGRGPAMATALGILAGNAGYFLLSATGIGALITASPRAFAGLRWAGAAYLFWLGLRLMWPHAAGAAVMDQAAPDSARTWRGGVLRGWLVQISNPKALVFFVALLPQFIDPRFAVAWQLLVLGLSSVCIEWCVLWGYAALAARARELARPRLVRAFEVAGCCCLLAIAARIALGR